jgi:hypothetical protein
MTDEPPSRPTGEPSERDLGHVAEALSRVRGILADLIDEADADPDEYADDLDRLDEIAALLS